jgi:hypothetical protein
MWSEFLRSDQAKPGDREIDGFDADERQDQSAEPIN